MQSINNNTAAILVVPCCLRHAQIVPTKKGSWEPQEDAVIKQLVGEGVRRWSIIATHVPGRTGKQCRERYAALCAPVLEEFSVRRPLFALLLHSFPLQYTDTHTYSHTYTHAHTRLRKLSPPTLALPYPFVCLCYCCSTHYEISLRLQDTYSVPGLQVCPSLTLSRHAVTCYL